jgi:hypothetical protein
MLPLDDGESGLGSTDKMMLVHLNVWDDGPRIYIVQYYTTHHDQCRELRNVRVLTSLFDIALFLLWKTNDPLQKLFVLTAVFNLPTIKSINPDAHAVGVMCNCNILCVNHACLRLCQR